jgi:hypothetical protein
VTASAGFWWGLLGGLLPVIVDIQAQLRLPRARQPAWFTSPAYWIVRGALVLAGGVIVVAYMQSGNALQPWAALHIGASSPLLISALIRRAPRIRPGRGG